MSPIAGYDGFGRQEGWVEADGERFTLGTDTHLGTRDHHWGTRDGVGGPGRYMGMQHPHSGEWVEFADFGIWGDHVLYNIGDPRKRSATLARRVHRMRFEPDTHLLLSGEVDLVFADGSVKTMTFERLGNQIAFLRCGMYGGPNGGTPDGDLWHGMAVAQGDEVVVHAETFDVNDPAVRSRLAGQDQHHCRVTCDGEVTYGLVEPYDTLCYEVAKAGVMGFSLLDGDPQCRRATGRGRGTGRRVRPPEPSRRDRPATGLTRRLQARREDRAHRVVAPARVAGDALVPVVDGQRPRQREDLVPGQVRAPRSRSAARSAPAPRARNGKPGTRRPNSSSIMNSSPKCQPRSISRGPIAARSQSSTPTTRRSSSKTRLPRRTSPQSSTGSRSAGTWRAHQSSASPSAGSGSPSEDHST